MPPTKIVPIIAPSILACDFACLRDECLNVLSSAGGSAEWLHLDVMDAHFVPNLTFGPPIITCLRKHLPDAYFDVHLMISEPRRWVEEYAKAGANQYTFHIEATKDLDEARTIAAAIKKAGMDVGVSVKPGTSIEVVYPLCDEGLVDTVLVMTVEPGFGGQTFMANMMPKVAAARARYPNLNIEVDGGLAADTIQAAADAGANAIVAGTSIFKAKDRRAAIQHMRDVVDKAIQKRGHPANY